jgi:hypothetical protein
LQRVPAWAGWADAPRKSDSRQFRPVSTTVDEEAPCRISIKIMLMSIQAGCDAEVAAIPAQRPRAIILKLVTGWQ